VGIKIGVFKDAFGELYEEIAEARNALYVKNIWKGIFGNPKLMSDSIHPNAEGYRLMAERLAVELEALLEAA
jgi:lysophospholipase L1-like esterase